MAVKVRISRIGRRNRPFFRIVVADDRCKRDGKFIENLGTYDPINKAIVKIDLSGIENWVKKGAQMTSAVSKIIKMKKA